MKKEWILICVLIGIIFSCKKKIKELKVPISRRITDSLVFLFPELSKPLVIPELEILRWPAVRTVERLGKVLSDIDSHMPADHQYRDVNKITWAHETTHGINANIRNKHIGKKVNGFYCLEDRAVVVEEPQTKIGTVDSYVPSSWKGTCHDLYLVQQRRDWNDCPLYLCDEWVAYTNGAACRKDLGMTEQESEVEFTCEFTGYVLVLAYTVKKECPYYDDKQFKAFVMWQVERMMKIYNNEGGATKRLEAIRKGIDGEVIRLFARSYFGEKWCMEMLGF